ncbi:hypothetical protein RND71_014843 [Anisodus tanguticus]|uniref:Uncharacterized protein n=1 Tax=Anisodus tanguticus TaxID=243964 RepID=A0AAE1SCM5_9SOLA|nr:hypothetical protein RND71_014843 [Anisodus tanguticus]
MSISLEALAMMGADYVKDGISMEEFERHEEQVPPYLLADDQEDDDNDLLFSRKIKNNSHMSREWKIKNNSHMSREFHRCENDEGEKKKKLSGNKIFWEFLKKKDVASFLRLVGIIFV